MNQTPGSSSISALNYMNNQNEFLKGSNITSPAGQANNVSSPYTMVDLSAWELSTSCGSCHPGGGFVEKDRNGKRFSMMNPMVDGITPYNYTVFEKYNSATGLPEHQLQQAPWAYPMYNGQTPVITPSGWGQGISDTEPYMITMPDGSQMPMFNKQVMMPNVKEFDCLMCHLQGYSNMMSSAATYMGAHNATPSMGAGFINQMTQAYDLNTGLIQKDGNGIVSLTPAFFTKMKANPDTQNCRNCHIPSGLKDLPDMFKDFLSSAPMDYKGDYTKSFTGLEMVAFDLNAPNGTSQGAFSHDWTAGPFTTSPTVYMTQTGLGVSLAGTSPFIPAGFPAAMGMTPYNQELAMSTPGFVGGGNPAGSGPMYYNSTMDQNKLKKSTVAFARAEWFKRGDIWADGFDVHLKLECSGCHMDTKTTKVDQFVDPMGTINPNTSFDGKSLCDPAKGYDSAAGVEGNTLKRNVTNSQDTVKKCDNCHITGKNQSGVAIDTFGASNPTAAHTAAGLLKNVTQAMKTTDGSNEVTFRGNHMDVIDCTVCHLMREQMAVRSLDSLSGNRYPNMIGYAAERGMPGMFSDPAPGMIPANTNLRKWEPLYTWQRYGNYWKTKDDGTANENWRRKVYAHNIITALIWNNVNPTIDANGDGVNGGPALHHTGDYPGAVTANYDVWIARDLKAGITFGASGFAPIPIGFGGGNYMSAYYPDGTFTGAWQYVGVYGGNIAFSTPEEISSYKAYRTQIKDLVDGKSWDKTQLALLGGPYKVTHGIRPTSTFVLGKSCADCHSGSPKASIFSGGFDMMGTAIKTAPHGEFMRSPAQQYTVVAGKEDLETGAEVSTKVGGFLEIPFTDLGNWDPATRTFTPAANGEFKRTRDLNRSEALYPIEQPYIDALGRTYANRAAWINYITNPVAVGNTANTLAP